MAASTAQTAMLHAPIPRGEKRRREIAIVAERVFFEQGFTETTMQAIAAHAGASKETLYRHFGSKEELFAEIVACRARAFLEDLDERFESKGNVGDVLRALGSKILETMVGDEAVRLCRIVIAETSRDPALGSLFMAAGPDRVRVRLTEFFEAANARGELGCPDCERAARIFLGAVMSSYHLSQLVLHKALDVSTLRLRAHVDESVDMFMRQYAISAA